MKNFLILCIAAFLATTTYAQQMGAIKDYVKDGSTVTVNSIKGKIIIQQYAKCGWKVTTLTEGQTLTDERASVTLTGSQRGMYDVTVTDTGTELNISTGASSVLVDKQTSLLSFVDNGVVRLREKTCLDNSANDKTVTFQPQNDQAFYGGGYNGKYGNLEGQSLRMNNTQRFNWDQNTPGPNNICVPFIVSSNGYGVLFEDHFIDATIKPSRTEGISYSTQSPTPISYVYVGSEDGSQAGVMQTYAALTGTHELPPYWALGYITSRYGYHTQQETEEVINALEQAKMPVSGVVLDLFWEGEKQNGMGNLDWYKPNWPDAEGMVANFKQKGVHTILITEPYFAEETTNYQPLLEAGLLADPTCPNMQWVSDNKVGIIDFMNPQSIDWYWNFYKARTNEGVDGWWLDLGEPEMITEGTIHADGSTHLQAHNEFGLKWIEGVWTKWKQDFPNQRPLFLPRSGTSGMHRYATFPWTGDIARSWSGLKCQVPALINGGMSGLGYLSSDIGGFVAETEDPNVKIVDANLYLRWFQLGIFTPVLRTHGQHLPEPYQPEYSEYTSKLSQCITMRYQMLPYIYSVSWLNTTMGLPITAPANLYTDESQEIADLDDEYLFGPNILVAPISEPNTTGRKVVLPSGEWVDIFNLQSYAGNQTINFTADDDLHIPAFLRRGTFTPFYAQDTFTTMEAIDRSKLMIVYPLGSDKAWDFTLYDDDHLSAQVGNQYELIKFSGEEASNSHLITIQQQCEENYDNRPSMRELKFLVLLREGQKVESVTSSTLAITNVQYDEQAHTVMFTATVPSQSDTQNTVSINFNTSTAVNDVERLQPSSNTAKKYLLGSSHIIIESKGQSYNANGTKY